MLELFFDCTVKDHRKPRLLYIYIDANDHMTYRYVHESHDSPTRPKRIYSAMGQWS